MESAALHWLTKEIKEFNVQIKRIGVNMQYHRYTLPRIISLHFKYLPILGTAIFETKNHHSKTIIFCKIVGPNSYII